jgi:hypothetical protein
MSGIVGSYFNTRGSGVVAKLGTDGQVFTSTGAGLSQGFEAAAGGGKVGQIVQTVVTADASQSGSSGTWYDASGMTVAITPAASSSKILIMLDAKIGSRSGYGMAMKIQRDIDSAGYADIYVSTAPQSSQLAALVGSIHDSGSYHEGMGNTYLDSPSYSLTDVITYKMQWHGETSNTVYLNRTWDDANSNYYWKGASSFTAMEILA